MKIFVLFLIIFVSACKQGNETPLATTEPAIQTKQEIIEPAKPEAPMSDQLSPEEEYVIIHKGTERAFTGKFDKHYEKGVYTCRKCKSPLYRSESKFKSGCGWPSFDDEIKGAVKRNPDPDGHRVEIVCAKCDGHLGHVFAGEGFTEKNTRHCVNSISMQFIPEEKLSKAIFASGCFWGTEYHFNKLKGVFSATSGYIGGNVKNPTYQQVCTGLTGHAEAIEVIYDPTLVSYETLAKLYFETHDPTQLNRQGPDIGTQYRSEIFYNDEAQKEVALKLIEELKKKGYNVVTKVTLASEFYDAEAYHQDYYERKGTLPYCHTYQKKFD
jgi:peptide methionine sulfoxide reductase msrA/msrB